MNKELIQLKNINVVFTNPNGEKFNALKDLSLDICHGEYVSLVGTSGSGKTTLANILGLLARPLSGEYYFEGENLINLNESERIQLRGDQIGFIFQDYILIDHLSALENVALALSYQKGTRREALELAREQLFNMGLGNKLQHLPRQLSGGQKQRVAIARALLKRPKVILADEPTGALDHSSRFEVLSILQELNSQGITVITVTHSEEDAQASKRIVRVEKGQIVSDNPQRLRTRFFGKSVTNDERQMESRIRSALDFIHFNFGIKTASDFIAMGHTANSNDSILSCLTQFKNEWIEEVQVQDLLLSWFKESEEFIKVKIVSIFLSFLNESDSSHKILESISHFFNEQWNEESSLSFLQDFKKLKLSLLKKIIRPDFLLNHNSLRVRASSTLLFEFPEIWSLSEERTNHVMHFLQETDGRVVANTLDFLLNNPILDEKKLRQLKIRIDSSPRARANWCKLLLSWNHQVEAMELLEPMLKSSDNKEVVAAVWVMASTEGFNLHEFTRQKISESPEFIGHLDAIIGAFRRAQKGI